MNQFYSLAVLIVLFSVVWNFTEGQLGIDGIDCADIKQRYPSATSGVYHISATAGSCLFKVYCDMDTTGGGWTVFQRRQDGSVDFYRPWADYANGFGNPANEFWLGNDHLAALTAARQYKLRIDLGDFSGNSRYAEYGVFNVSDATDKYRVTFESYTGDAGDALSDDPGHNGFQFSTSDQDNDAYTGNCAVICHGAWWYNNCHHANLNGEYNNTTPHKGLNWYEWKDFSYSLRFTEMKIRPVNY
jgi:ficolin